MPCFVYAPAPGAPSALAESVVLHLHGGPEEQAKRTFSATIAALTLAGHTVVVPNVRGSTGFGKRWYSLDDGRRRFDAFADLAAVHAYLPELGLNPETRGASAASRTAATWCWPGSTFQPLLWAAGVDIVGISSLVTYLERTSPYRRALREREYGTLAHDREFLAAASPLSSIDDVVAPLFVIHGRNDPRVPVSEADQLHAALAANGVECELHVFDDEGHGLVLEAGEPAAGVSGRVRVSQPASELNARGSVWPTIRSLHRGGDHQTGQQCRAVDVPHGAQEHADRCRAGCVPPSGQPDPVADRHGDDADADQRIPPGSQRWSAMEPGVHAIDFDLAAPAHRAARPPMTEPRYRSAAASAASTASTGARS